MICYPSKFKKTQQVRLWIPPRLICREVRSSRSPFEEGKLKVRFSRAYIIKTMSGSEERTRWWQTGELVFA